MADQATRQAEQVCGHDGWHVCGFPKGIFKADIDKLKKKGVGFEPHLNLFPSRIKTSLCLIQQTWHILTASGYAVEWVAYAFAGGKVSSGSFIEQ